MTSKHDAKELTRTAENNAALRQSVLKPFLADTLHWSNDGPLDISHIVAAMIGMAGPIAIGVLFGNLGFGLLASFGAMVVSGAVSGYTIRQRAVKLTRTMLVGTAAMFASGLIGGQGWLTGGFIVIISALAALLGGMSRPAAIAGNQFMVFTIMGTGIGAGGLHQHPYVLAVVFAIGSIWGMLVALSVTSLFQSSGNVFHSTPAAAISNTERLRHWRRSLTHFSGWQYTLRIALCMAAAEGIGIFLHQQRSYWISLTVAIVLQRNFASAFTRTCQRGIGTAAGVLLGSLLLLKTLPPLSIVLIVGMLAALRPIFRNRNYAIYAMLMTPLMVVMFSLGETVTGSLLFERLLDTIIGCLISLVFGYYIWPGRNTLSRKVH